jgi:hypothetical protein
MVPTNPSDIKRDWLVIIDFEDNRESVKESVEQATLEELADKAVEVLKKFLNIKRLSFEPINKTEPFSDQQA